VNTLSLTLREEPTLRVPEKRVLRGILGPKKEEVTRSRTNYLKDWLHNLLPSLNIIRKAKLRLMR
jgi:hypothetical protein